MSSTSILTGFWLGPSWLADLVHPAKLATVQPQLLTYKASYKWYTIALNMTQSVNQSSSVLDFIHSTSSQQSLANIYRQLYRYHSYDGNYSFHPRAVANNITSHNSLSVLAFSQGTFWHLHETLSVLADHYGVYIVPEPCYEETHLEWKTLLITSPSSQQNTCRNRFRTCWEHPNLMTSVKLKNRLQLTIMSYNSVKCQQYTISQISRGTIWEEVNAQRNPRTEQYNN